MALSRRSFLSMCGGASAAPVLHVAWHGIPAALAQQTP